MSPLLRALEREFKDVTGHPVQYDAQFREAAVRFTDWLSDRELLPLEMRRTSFLAHVNRKFRVNAKPIGVLYASAAAHGYTFNYPQKQQIQLAFDRCDPELFAAVIAQVVPNAAVREGLAAVFEPFSFDRTIEVLKSECNAPSRLRKPSNGRDVSRDILQSQFGAYLYCAARPQQAHEYFDPTYDEANYCESFWHQLHARASHLFDRDHALYVLHIATDLLAGTRVEQTRERACSWLADAYSQLNNHSYVAILIDSVQDDAHRRQWALAADLALFAERHLNRPLTKPYFRWKQILSDTRRHIPRVSVARARFDLVSDGFVYRDCFVVSDQSHEPRLLLLLQKNERDETLIPCPTCRSHDVQGNSYPTLGVRSWECNNLLCPDRSKYNRGKRYSFKGLLMQQAIEDPRNTIPTESVRTWLRDVQPYRTDTDILEMLIRHYSLSGDTVHLFDWSEDEPQSVLGRTIEVNRLPDKARGVYADFQDGPLFHRFLAASPNRNGDYQKLGDDACQVFCGNALYVLRQTPSDVFDGAVTSPPYYNAKSYSYWPNLYCYLHDMHAIGTEVFRCLRPGSLYLYNIFDCFDNERIIAMSAMGQKRLTLSAFAVDSFRRIGFEMVGAIAWDKGDIEGKRGFNAGNYSPYYQSPFNCWEHILVVRKPAERAELPVPELPTVLRVGPVIKYVNGQNIHGHTAPFPDEIPALLIAGLPAGSCVLDPFAGSLTTGRVADRMSVKSVCIELHREYCELGLLLLNRQRAAALQQSRQRQLF